MSRKSRTISFYGGYPCGFFDSRYDPMPLLRALTLRIIYTAVLLAPHMLKIRPGIMLTNLGGRVACDCRASYPRYNF